jgi:glycosyltransferase involved in cell wall biosynthesis
MKIHLVADHKSDWYPQQAYSQFSRYTACEVVDNPQQADLIWIMSYYLPTTPWLLLPESVYRYIPLSPKVKPRYHHTPIVTTIHHLLPEKRTYWEEKIKILKLITTVWHFPSQMNQQFCQAMLGLTATVHLPYWIDTTKFYPLSSAQRYSMRHRYQLPPDKLIIGSFQRDTEADNVTPKKEKGPDIFCDIIESLPRQNVHVLLSGTRRNYIENRLHQAGVSYTNVGKVPFAEMNVLYNCLDYYLVTSRFEGGPQAILECMTTRTRILSTSVGIANVLHPETIFSTPQECAEMISQSYSDEILNYHQKMVTRYRCQEVIPQYDHFLNQLAPNEMDNSI